MLLLLLGVLACGQHLERDRYLEDSQQSEPQRSVPTIPDHQSRLQNYDEENIIASVLHSVASYVHKMTPPIEPLDVTKPEKLTPRIEPLDVTDPDTVSGHLDLDTPCIDPHYDSNAPHDSISNHDDDTDTPCLDPDYEHVAHILKSDKNTAPSDTAPTESIPPSPPSPLNSQKPHIIEIPPIQEDQDKGKYTYDKPQFREHPPYSARFDPWIARDALLLDPTMRRLNIGVTISIRPSESSIFTNGAKQAAFFFRQTLASRHNIVMINLDRGTIDNIGNDWNIQNIPIISWEDSQTRRFDIVVEQGMQLAKTQLDLYRTNGAKVVTFRTGNDYFLSIENMIFRKESSSLFTTKGYDMVWTLPSFNATSCFQHIAFGSEVVVAPYVWSSFFIDGTTPLLPNRRKYLREERSTPVKKIIATFEPNLNVVKSSVIPMTIIEAFYRRYPHLVEKAIITNTAKLVNSSDEFVHFAAGMDITTDKKIWFEGRYKFPWFMSNYADVVLTHHWANGLNFLYIDALYLRYPLVHNSEYFKECGYYYVANDLESAIDALHKAITTHDDTLAAYAAAADACIYHYSVHNPRNVVQFEHLMKRVLAQPSKVENVS